MIGSASLIQVQQPFLKEQTALFGGENAHFLPLRQIRVRVRIRRATQWGRTIKMILDQPDTNSQRDAFDERRVMPSKRIISSLGSLTNGFLFSTTPIILRILKELCPNVAFLFDLECSLTIQLLPSLLLVGSTVRSLEFYCLDFLAIRWATIRGWLLQRDLPSSAYFLGILLI